MLINTGRNRGILFIRREIISIPDPTGVMLTGVKLTGVKINIPYTRYEFENQSLTSDQVNAILQSIDSDSEFQLTWRVIDLSGNNAGYTDLATYNSLIAKGFEIFSFAACDDRPIRVAKAYQRDAGAVSYGTLSPTTTTLNGETKTLHMRVWVGLFDNGDDGSSYDDRSVLFGTSFSEGYFGFNALQTTPYVWFRYRNKFNDAYTFVRTAIGYISPTKGWTDIDITYGFDINNNMTIKFYIDSVLESEHNIPYSTTIGEFNPSHSIGEGSTQRTIRSIWNRYTGSFQNYFLKTKCHSVGVWNRELSQLEIEQIHNNNLVGLDNECHFFLKLEEEQIVSKWYDTFGTLNGVSQTGIGTWSYKDVDEYSWADNVGYTDNAGLIVPRDESNISLDTDGNPLEHTRKSCNVDGILPQTTQYIDRMAVKPSNERILIIDEFIQTLVYRQIWDKLDFLHLFYGHDEVSCFQNMIQDDFHTIPLNPLSSWDKDLGIYVDSNLSSGDYLFDIVNWSPVDGNGYNYDTGNKSIGCFYARDLRYDLGSGGLVGEASNPRNGFLASTATLVTRVVPHLSGNQMGGGLSPASNDDDCFVITQEYPTGADYEGAAWFNGETKLTYPTFAVSTADENSHDYLRLPGNGGHANGHKIYAAFEGAAMNGFEDVIEDAFRQYKSQIDNL